MPRTSAGNTEGPGHRADVEAGGEAAEEELVCAVCLCELEALVEMAHQQRRKGRESQEGAREEVGVDGVVVNVESDGERGERADRRDVEEGGGGDAAAGERVGSGVGAGVPRHGSQANQGGDSGDRDGEWRDMDCRR